MDNMTIFYLLDEKGQKEDIIQGFSGKQLQRIETPITDKLLKLPSTKITANGTVISTIGFTLIENTDKAYYDLMQDTIEQHYAENIALSVKLNYYYSGEPYITTEHGIYKFSTKMSVDGLYNWESKRLSNIERDNLEKMLIIEKNKFAEQQEKIRLETIKNEKEQENARKEKEKKEIELRLKEEEQIKKFIFGKGSDYLQLLYNRNYDYYLQYAKEFKYFKGLDDYIIDCTENAEWSVLSEPSLELLKEEQHLSDLGYDVYIVDLYEPPIEDKNKDKDEVSEEFNLPCHAILIQDFLGKYNLFKPVEW